MAGTIMHERMQRSRHHLPLSSKLRFICGQAERDWSLIQGSKTSIEGTQDKRCYLCGSLTKMGSFDRKRKAFVLLLGFFRGPFFHQRPKGFLFVLFLSVLTFTHVRRPYICV